MFKRSILEKVYVETSFTLLESFEMSSSEEIKLDISCILKGYL